MRSISTFERADKFPQINFWLRIITTIASLIGMILFGAAMSQTQYTVGDDGYAALTDIFPFGPLAFSFLWCLSFLITVWVKSRKAPMHPGFAVGFDFTSFAGLISCSVLSAIFINTPSTCYRDKYNECLGEWIAPAERTALVLAFVSVVCHFILFVFACMACEAIRKERKTAKMNAYVYELTNVPKNETPDLKV
ncbi:hypothetical protein FQN53_008532 [Emmonsiellopsis sp. PD_33]|nr:hypothetical protein FQN53_008532 [Emmonsiellopsis sp. PD_33]